jgi:molybdopterin converting factor small subunit
VRVFVEFFGPAREAADTVRQAVECEMPTTSHDLVARIAREHAGRLANLLLEDGRLSASVLVAVNDVQTVGPMPLRDGDEITVVPPVSGGAAE